MDVEVNFDEWIDEYCADADLFIFVLNSESVCEEYLDTVKSLLRPAGTNFSRLDLLRVQFKGGHY